MSDINNKRGDKMAQDNKPSDKQATKYTTGKTDSANMVSTPMGQTEKVIAGIAIVIVAIIAFFIVKSISGAGDIFNQPADNKTNTTSEQQAVDQKPEAKLAKEVEAKFLEFWGFKSTSEFLTAEDMPDSAKIYGFINGFEDINSSTVRVFVQTDVTKDEAKDIGKHIMGAVGLDLENLDFIVVRGTDGLDVNVSRNDIPALRR
jgi:cell division protein FtsL